MPKLRTFHGIPVLRSPPHRRPRSLFQIVPLLVLIATIPVLRAVADTPVATNGIISTNATVTNGTSSTNSTNSTKLDPEDAAKASFAAAEKSAREAEAAVVPMREAMQKADKAYAEARKSADAKRQQATEAKNLAGDPGVKELQQAEGNLAAAAKALAEATTARPPLDKEAADAKAAAAPLQQSFDAIEKAAREAEAAAKAASESANRLDIEAKRAATQAANLRRAADTAKAALTRAQQSEQNLERKGEVRPVVSGQSSVVTKGGKTEVGGTNTTNAQVIATGSSTNSQGAASAGKDDVARKATEKEMAAAAQKLARALAQKNLVEAQLAGAKKQVATATTASQAAEQAAQAAEKSAEEKRQLAADATAKRKAAADGPGAVAAAQKAEQQAQARASAAVKKVADAETQKKAADAELEKKTVVSEGAKPVVSGQSSVVSATNSSQLIASTTNSQGIATASTTNSQATGTATNSQAIAKAEEAVTVAKKKLADAQAEKKAADDALASAKSKVAAAVSANQAAQVAAREFLQLDDTAQQATAIATAQRKLANDAKAALAPKAKASEQAAIKANTAAQTLTRAEARKKSAEEALDGLKKRIASAKQSHVADEEAAKQAEAAAVPLKAEAEKTRAAYLAAGTAADEKRSAAEKAKAVVFRLAAARQIASLMESPAPAAPANAIDDLVFAKLKSFGIQPVLCSDAVFVRRAFLDVTGTLPSEQEARSFIQGTDPKKRVALIDQLLERPDHVDYWAMKWSDILRVKAEFPVKVWPNAAQAYHRWIWEAIAQNKPYDTFARELLTSSGSNFRVGPVNFFRAIQDKTPEGIASAVGLALMGTRVQLWPAERRAGMGAFFSQVGYKPTSEWKEEVVFWDPLNSAALPGSTAPGVDSVAKAIAATCQIPQALAKPLSEKGPLEAVFPDGTKTTVPPNRDPREVFAEWLIRPENPWFGKAVVNRTWAWIMGRGIIHEADDIREGNAPVNPELLALLEKELVTSRYNLKHLRRLIFTSTTYQLSPIPKTDRPEARAHFANYLMRRVDAEVLNDVLNHITGSTDLYTSAVPEPFTYIPREMTAVEVADGSITSSFLTLFGRSARGTGMESERVNELASPQWLYMLNSSQMQSKLQGGPRLATLLSSGGKPNEIAEKLYLTVLSRFPTEADLRAVENYTKAGVTKGRDMWMDLAWALINSPEFLFRH
jgi:hypothetical protein